MFELLHDFDQRLFEMINGWGTPYWDFFMSTYSARWTWVPLYGTILYVLIRNFNWKVVLVTTLTFVLVITFADQLCASVLRPWFERLRPSHTPELRDTIHLFEGRRGGRYGFPSCHAANTAALTLFLFLFFKYRAIYWFFGLWVATTCYSRLYLGVHYLGDVLFGVFVGAGIGYLVYKGYRWIMDRRIGSRLGSLTELNRIRHPRRMVATAAIAWVGWLTIIAFAAYGLFL